MPYRPNLKEIEHAYAQMLANLTEIDNRVHYGVDNSLQHEYAKAFSATADKFTKQVPPLREYYRKKTKKQDANSKIVAEIYISLLGIPQLYIEGNHIGADQL